MKHFLVICFLVCGQLSRGEIKSPLDLIVPPTASLISPEKVTAAQVKEDIDLLVEAFKKSFSGKFYFSPDQLEKSKQSLLSIQGDMSTQDFWKTVDDVLLRIPDNHTSATMFLNGYNMMSPQRMARIRRPQVGRNRISNVSKVWEVSRVGKDNDVTLIAITRFPSAQDPIWNGFLESVRKTLEVSRAAIIDLRSNSGGDDYFGMEMAKIFWGGPFHHLVQKQYNNTSPEALALFANHFRIQSIQTGQAQNPNSISEQIVKSFLPQIDQAMSGAVPDVQIRAKQGSDPKATVTASGYQKPIYVLIDALTASSGEFTALAFFLHPNAVILGENSAGYIHFGNPGKVLLPNSKIQVSISTQFSQLEGNLFIEKVGITPKKVVPPGSDAFEAAIREIEALGKSPL